MNSLETYNYNKLLKEHRALKNALQSLIEAKRLQALKGKSFLYLFKRKMAWKQAINIIETCTFNK